MPDMRSIEPVPLDADGFPLKDPIFVVLWDDGAVTTVNERAISNMHDMADCGFMEGVKQILAVSEKCELVPIVIGEQSRLIDPEEDYPFYYAHAPIMAGKRRVGTVTYTDH